MTAVNSHFALPLPVGIRHPITLDQALPSMQAFFQLVGQSIEVNDKVYALRAWESAEIAEAALRQSDDLWKATPLHKHQAEDKLLWLTITSLNDPTRPDMLIRETFPLPEFTEILLARIANAQAIPEQAHMLDNCLANFTSSGGEPLTFKTLLLGLALHEVLNDIAVDMRGLPYTESMDLSDRDRYLKKPFDVDPVEAIQSDDPWALQNAAIEANVVYIGKSESDAVKEAMKSWASAQEDFEPVLDLLGVSEEEAEAFAEKEAEQIVQYAGALDFELKGNCAITAIPYVGTNQVYITFDGITSSFMNAVPDESYFAMLDMLRIDVRGWVDKLLTSNEMPAANWNIDIKALMDGLPTRENSFSNHQILAGKVKQVLFNLPTDATPLPVTNEDAAPPTLDGIATRIAQLRDQMRAEVSDEIYDKCSSELQALYAEAAALKEVQENRDANDGVHNYILAIAQQVLIAQADELDTQWYLDNGIDLDVLQSIDSSAAQRLRYPQLDNSPNYGIAMSNMAIELDSGNCFYEWRTPPHKAATAPNLISYASLIEIMNNASYSGNAVIAFEASLDDLTKIGNGLHGQDQQVTVSNAYFHIHDFNNGAGDGAALDGDWIFSTKDIKEKHLRIDNDSCDSYGIQGCFGQFLAEGSSIEVGELPQTEVAKHADNSSPAP